MNASAVGARSSARVNDQPSRLHLFDGPYVVESGTRTEIPEGSRRLVAFVALNGPTVERRYAAGTLWSAVDDERAAGNLRCALWRLRSAGIQVLDSDKRLLWLRHGTTVDVHLASAWSARMVSGTASQEDLVGFPWQQHRAELLPGRAEEWICLERERIRQRWLHALEALAGRLVAEGRAAEAVHVATSLVWVEPRRASSLQALARTLVPGFRR